MTSTPSPKLMTAEELSQLADDGYLYELDAGRLIRMAAAGPRSSIVAANVLTPLNTYVRSHRLGICGGADFGLLLARDPDTLRVPDVVFYRAERIPPEGVPRQFWQAAPDLAVEVLSPTDRPGAVLKKIGEYLDAGTRLVWLLDPDRRRATVYRPDGTVTVLGEDGVLAGEDVLPGFRLPLAEVWV